MKTHVTLNHKPAIGLLETDWIDIVFTGIRPGEKLFEELLTAEEGTEASKYKKSSWRKTTANRTTFLLCLKPCARRRRKKTAVRSAEPLRR